MEKLEEFHYFTTPIYAVKLPQFLEPIRKISNQYLAKSRARHKNKKNPMTVMTASFSHEPEAAEFAQYISQTAWNIFAAQGYNMDNLVTFFQEMWTQEHNFQSAMETHVHGNGAAISAFYFLSMPKNAMKMVIHDPRPAKVIINLPVKDSKKVSPASPQVVFTPEEGTLIFTPAWLPHQFSRNINREQSVKFVHMNLGVMQAPEEAKADPKVEVI
jgi:uncharacterized protein (TIGR02466 family)